MTHHIAEDFEEKVSEIFMKTALLFLLVSFPLMADVLTVSGMKGEPNMERSFFLKTQLEDPVLLDCQSFLQGIYIGPRNGGAFFMMEPPECEALYNHIRGSLRKFKKHCIDIEDAVNSDESC
jgi:hypothetical protein